MLDGELLLLSAGLLKPPGADEVSALRALETELRELARGITGAPKQGPLRVNPQSDRYFDRLTKFKAGLYDYGPAVADLAHMVGFEVAGDWQRLHMSAVQFMLDRYPRSIISSVVGDVFVESDPESLAQYRLEADTIERPQRILWDLAAGAVLAEQQDVFASVAPETYAMMVKEIRDECSKRHFADPEWLPAWWLEDALRVFLELPPEGNITSTPGGAKMKPVGKLENVIDSSLTTAQTTLR